jgi:thioredoxin-dependent peroxiredoxin
MSLKPLSVLFAAAALIALPALASLQVGDQAPDFKSQASLGGKVFKFSLAKALKKGPVVLYFYPAAFTRGCTIEAHDFAEATDQYKALGASVIGVSHDGIDKLKEFSVSECAVAADPDESIIKTYDVVLAQKPEFANRTSYVIAPDGKIIYVYTDLHPDHHVENTLAALKEWKAKGVE